MRDEQETRRHDSSPCPCESNNVQADLDRHLALAQIVAHGPGIGMLNVQRPTDGDVPPQIDCVPTGGVVFTERQGEGNAYVRP